MNENLAKGIRRIRDSFSKGQTMRLRQTSNQLIEDAALKNDRMLAEASVIAYSLHKTLSKPHIVEHKEWEKAKKRILLSLNQSIESLKQENLKGFSKKLESISESLKGVDGYLSHFVQSLHDKAKIKQASRAYAMGLSLSSASQLTGAEKRNVLEYIGRTNIHDSEEEGMRMGKRMKKLREVFE